MYGVHGKACYGKSYMSYFHRFDMNIAMGTACLLSFSGGPQKPTRSHCNIFFAQPIPARTQIAPCDATLFDQRRVQYHGPCFHAYYDPGPLARRRLPCPLQGFHRTRKLRYSNRKRNRRPATISISYHTIETRFPTTPSQRVRFCDQPSRPT